MKEKERFQEEKQPHTWKKTITLDGNLGKQVFIMMHQIILKQKQFS